MTACLITSVPIAIVYNLFVDRFVAGFRRCNQVSPLWPQSDPSPTSAAGTLDHRHHRRAQRSQIHPSELSVRLLPSLNLPKPPLPTESVWVRGMVDFHQRPSSPRWFF